MFRDLSRSSRLAKTHSAHRRRRWLLIVVLPLLVAGCRHPAGAPLTMSRQDRERSPVELPAVQPASFQAAPDPVSPPPNSEHDAAVTEPTQPEPVRVGPASARTLADFEQLALTNHPALNAAAARLDAAQGAWWQAGLRPNPVIGYSGQQLGAGGIAEQQGAFLGQTFVTGHKLQLQREAAAWQVQRAEFELEAARLRVLTDVRTAFYRLVVAQRRLELARRLVDISHQAVKAAEALYRGKEVSKADPLRAQVAEQEARIALTNAQKRFEAARRQLAAVTGINEDEIEDVDGSIDPAQWHFTWESQLAKLLDESPQLAAALAQVESARWRVERAYAEVVPNVEVQAVVQDDQGTGNTNANLQITLPLPLWNRNQGGIQEAFGQAVAAEQEVDRTILGLRSRLAAAFQRYETARQQVEQYSGPSGILAKAQQTLDLIRAGYEAGEFNVLELLAAQRTFFETNLAYLDALGALATAAAEIDGLLLSNSLDSEP